MHGRGCAWQGACVEGGMHGRVCMVGGMHGREACVVGGHAWQVGCMAGGACMAGGHAWQGACMADTATYASYWNAFLFLLFLLKVQFILQKDELSHIQ